VIARRTVVSGLVGAVAGVAAVPVRAQLMNPFTKYWENVVHSVEKNDAAAVEQLLASGSSPNGTNDAGRTGLHIAALNGNAEIADLLIKAGAWIDVKDPLGNTPLFYAADRDHVDVVDLLLAAGASPNQQNRGGVTPLMAAAQRGNVQIVQALLAKGGDPRKTDFTGRDAVSWAEEDHREMVVETLRRAASRER
jgi:uncharacterized protein